MANDVDRSALVDLLREALDESLPGERVVAAMGLDKAFPLGTLRLFDEGEELARVEAELRVELCAPLWIGAELAGAIAALRDQASQ